MTGGLKAVIFDMDGVLIESEHLWRKAMIMGFGEAGMTLTEEDCRQTTGLRI
ncbi:MAG: hexitol phosphatase HxpB, partial [Bacteroidia bacterium]|nr:hexitol phosphatase HxpB [Bacteroidia bacterium]